MLALHVALKREAQMHIAKRALRYLRGKRSRRDVVKPGRHIQFCAYVSVSWSNESGQNGRRQSGVLFNYDDLVLHSASHLQQFVSFSWTEAERIARADEERKMIWLRRVLQEFCIEQTFPKVFQGSYGSIKWATRIPAKQVNNRWNIDTRHNYSAQFTSNVAIDIVFSA